MDIPLNAEVKVNDGTVIGHSSCVVMNPISQEITHFAVEGKGLLHSSYLVPIGLIVESTPNFIQLRCSE